MWKNDSTYRGNALNNDFYFLSPIAKLPEGVDEYERNWVYLSEKVKNEWEQYFEKKNKKIGLDLPRPDDLTSYDNPDYLWLSFELQKLIDLYNLSMRNPNTNEIIPGCGQLPFVQLRLKATAFSKQSRYPKSTLNEYGQEYTPHYVIEFEKPFLDAFMKFIVAIFDDNPQELVEICGVKIITHQYVAPIYRMSPFDKHFTTRHDLPGIIFHKAVQMLLAHELAHIGWGHLDLQAKDPMYGRKVQTLLVEENDADTQAMCWVLGERFLEMENNQLDISLKDLYDELALSIFAVYVLFTWDYSKEERVWNHDMLKTCMKRDHLPYQLRAYRILSVSLERLNKLGKWCESEKISSIDNKIVTQKFMNKVMDEAMNMINAFEYSLHMFFVHTENVCELFLNEDFSELAKLIKQESEEQIPELKKENIPWCLGYEQQAQEILQQVEKLTNDVRKRLMENGTYCKIDFI